MRRRRERGGRGSILAACAAAWVGGCATTPPPEPSLPRVNLESGESTRADVLLEFGLPASTFEGDRVWSYPVAVREGEWVRGTGTEALGVARRAWTRGARNLIVSFDGEGAVERFALVLPAGDAE